MKARRRVSSCLLERDTPGSDTLGTEAPTYSCLSRPKTTHLCLRKPPRNPHLRNTVGGLNIWTSAGLTNALARPALPCHAMLYHTIQRGPPRQQACQLRVIACFARVYRVRWPRCTREKTREEEFSIKHMISPALQPAPHTASITFVRFMLRRLEIMCLASHCRVLYLVVLLLLAHCAFAPLLRVVSPLPEPPK